MLGVLIGLALLFVAPWLVTAAAVYPAFLLAGGRPRQMWLLQVHALVFTIVWGFSSVCGFVFLASSQTGPVGGLVPAAFAVGSFAIGGLAMAAILESMAPIRSPHRVLIAAGGALGLVGAALSYTGQFSTGSGTVPYGRVIFSVWAVVPFAALYLGAWRQRRWLRRHRAGDCVRCGYRGGGTGAVCTECGTPPPMMCSHCRRFVSALPNQNCPRCTDAIGAECWNCGYDWTGLDTDRCPECGVFQPASSASGLPGPANPA